MRPWQNVGGMITVILSILSALTSGPLVIQQQVKALRRLGSSGPTDVYAESESEPTFLFPVLHCIPCGWLHGWCPGLRSL
jgi:hypothetical protein